MALDCFMIISSGTLLGGIEALVGGGYHVGGSNDSRSAVNKKIELRSFQYGIEQIGEETGGRPRSVEHVAHGAFVVTKHVDSHTPKLFEICASAVYLSRVDIILFDGSLTTDDKGVVTQQDPYLAYTMKGVHIAGYTVDSAEGVPIERICLKYGSIAVGWNGGASGGTIHEGAKGNYSFGWSNMFDVGG
jgi:type VI secretion system Hcp family effector